MYLRLLLPVIGRDLVYVCFSQYFIKGAVSSFDTIPLLEGVVSTFTSPSYSLKVVSAFTTPAPHWKGLCLRRLHPPLHNWKVLYLRLLHHSLIGRDLVYVCFSQSFIKSSVSAFATAVPQ